MARAKRTDRAAARRRYRSEQGLADIDDDDFEEETEPAPRQATTAPGASSTGRRGFTTAFREAFHPLDWRADLRALPQLVRNKALWIPIALTLAASALFVAVRPQGREDPLAIITIFLYQYFIVTPAIGGVFIAGFLAPRASWLLGLIVGLVAAASYSVLLLSGNIGIAPTAQTESIARDAVLASFVMSPVVGAFFASTAAWYRRFLYLSNPNRGRARAAAGRRPDGRSRSADAAQKAGVRR